MVSTVSKSARTKSKKPRSRRAVLADALGQVEGEVLALVTRVFKSEEATLDELEEAVLALGELADRLDISEDLFRALRRGVEGSVWGDSVDNPAVAALDLLSGRRAS